MARETSAAIALNKVKRGICAMGDATARLPRTDRKMR